MQCVCEEDLWDTDTSSAFFFAPPNGQMAGTCDLAVCDPETERERTGMVTCEPATVDAREVDSQWLCSSFALCSQPAAIAGHDLLLQEYLTVSCKQASDQAWWCSCALSEDTASFELGEAVDGNDACTRASSHCAERMLLPISRHGIPAQPPDPLPAP